MTEPMWICTNSTALRLSHCEGGVLIEAMKKSHITNVFGARWAFRGPRKNQLPYAILIPSHVAALYVKGMITDLIKPEPPPTQELGALQATITSQIATITFK